MPSLSKLKEPFDKLYEAHRSHFLETDPVWFAHQYSDSRDQELVAFIASALAYGSVPQIFQILKKIFLTLGSSPVQFLLDQSWEKSNLLKGLYYRFHSENDLRLFFSLLSRAYRKHGSLGAMFQKHVTTSDLNIKNALTHWLEEMKEGRVPASSRVSFFFSSPRLGSACKRLNLFLRWMVRGPDGVDFGLWKFVSPSQLIMPVDTHVFRLASSLRLTRNKTPNWQMAEELTAKFAKLDPKDPVKYDFALTRLGILDLCPPAELKLLCRNCRKLGVCQSLK
jgi:uncharacterized protein (TIGR02757 family)